MGSSMFPKLFLVSAAFCLCTQSVMAADRIPLLIDTDIGADIDDAFAIALAGFSVVGAPPAAQAVSRNMTDIHRF